MLQLSPQAQLDIVRPAVKLARVHIGKKGGKRAELQQYMAPRMAVFNNRVSPYHRLEPA